MPLKNVPEAPLTPKKKKDEAPITPDKPQEMADHVDKDPVVQKRRKAYMKAVAKLDEQLVKMVKGKEGFSDVEKTAALGDLKSFIGKLSAKVEAFNMGQRTKFKISRNIGKLFKIEVGQDYLVGASAERPGPVAKPYKLKFKVKLGPIAVGHEQYNEKGEPMGLADKTKRFLEITVYKDGTTGVKLGVARKEDRTKDKPTTTDSLYAQVSTGSFMGYAEMSVPADQGLSNPTLAFVAAGNLGEGVKAGGFLNLKEIGGPGPQGGAAGLQVFGTW